MRELWLVTLVQSDSYGSAFILSVDKWKQDLHEVNNCTELQTALESAQDDDDFRKENGRADVFFLSFFWRFSSGFFVQNYTRVVH